MTDSPLSTFGPIILHFAGNSAIAGQGSAGSLHFHSFVDLLRECSLHFHSFVDLLRECSIAAKLKPKDGGLLASLAYRLSRRPF